MGSTESVLDEGTEAEDKVVETEVDEVVVAESTADTTELLLEVTVAIVEDVDTAADEVVAELLELSL